MKFMFLILFSIPLALEANFIPISGNFTLSEKTEVSNMPRVRSQDGLGICYAMAASTLFDFEYCRRKKNADCKNAPDNKKVSPLSLAALAEDPQKLREKVMSGNKNALTYTEQISIGGSVSTAIFNVLNNTEAISTEQCASLDLIFNIKTTSELAQIENVQKLNEKFSAIKNKNIDCVDCIADEINKMFPFMGSKEQIKLAFGEVDFEHFLYKLAIPPKCTQDENLLLFSKLVADLFQYPNTNELKNITRLEDKRKLFKDKIKSILASGRPLAIAEACVEDDKSPLDQSPCKQPHSVVVSGFAKACDSRGKNCKDVIKIQNSWGEKWQSENSDGWLLADDFLDRTRYVDGSLNWLDTPKQ